MVSEYLESLMSLSNDELKILENLQRNRKNLLEKTNNAAVTIQKYWRRLVPILGVSLL